MPEPGRHDRIRIDARRFEETLPGEQRKRLGQFFTGVPLGKLLVHLALAPDTRTVLDPMAGHGDLLDASNEAALERRQSLHRLDGIEIDQETARFCRKRIAKLAAVIDAGSHKIVCGSAFDSASIKALPSRSYDLVITNPPYVRYQKQNGNGSETVRSGLTAIIGSLQDSDAPVWKALADGYSGLADLSIPAWILAALMVRPEGRLALVVPATWRSREYGDIVRYLLLRCFRLEYIVEDTQPGWFSDALVRTHLIVARRLPPQEIARPFGRRATWPSACWLKIFPEAANARSLVGAAFEDGCPEGALARWLQDGAAGTRHGVEIRGFDLHDEWGALKGRVAHRGWYQKLEPDATNLPLFSSPSPVGPALPQAFRDTVGDALLPSIVTLEEAGIRVGQGLRTGCNRFFYVDALHPDGEKSVLVRSSAAFGHREFPVPADALRPVLRRQSELQSIENGTPGMGRVLDLRRWVIPEDAQIVAQAGATYRRLDEPVPATMPGALAAYVRIAADTPENDAAGKRVPELSAVRTNVRPHREGAATPRFWYMLPDFAPRHLPAAFVARIVHGAPWVECNLEPPVLVDANFSTFWPADKRWSGSAIKALLNSAWCQLLMETLGTPMGGGALKLEAVHLHRLAVPRVSNDQRNELDRLGRALSRHESLVLEKINAVVLDALGQDKRRGRTDFLALVSERAENMRRMRLRRAA